MREPPLPYLSLPLQVVVEGALCLVVLLPLLLDFLEPVLVPLVEVLLRLHSSLLEHPLLVQVSVVQRLVPLLVLPLHLRQQRLLLRVLSYYYPSPN